VGGCVYRLLKSRFWRTGCGSTNCRSLHFATPDFLWRLVALIKCMRLSLRKGAPVALSGAAWQEIRVRFGRDNKLMVTALPRHPLLLKTRNPNLVIRTEA
jgi:hypothetical protein